MRLLLRSLMVGLFLAGGYTFAQQQVYFSVDMNGEDIGVNDTVSIAGNLQVAAGFANDWTPGQIVMKDADGDGIYMDTLTLPAGSYEYKFTYLKAGAATWETPPGACTNSGGNRAVTVVAADTTLNTVCFNTCDASCPSGSGMVTFQVDVRNETFKPDSVSISGSLQMAAGFASNWTPGLTLMDDADGDSVYSITLTLPAGNYEYKFTLTDTSGSNVWEPFPGGNRQISVTDGLDTTLNANCFGTSFEVCPQDLPPINVTFRVNMANEFVSDSGLFIGGSFQDPQWQKNQIKLEDPDGDEVYEVTLSIKPNFYEYKYFNGANGDPSSDEFSETGDFLAGGCGLGGFGNNRALELINIPADTVLPAYNFNECNTVWVTDIEDDLDENGSFSIYPNPFSQVTNVEFSNPTGITYRFSLMNMAGQVVFQAETREDRLTINRKDLGAGMYLLRIQNPTGEQLTKKLIIQ
ncbi:MAG: T9SS type A sorting domain-containing protein [Bacteroidota bacterium]